MKVDGQNTPFFNLFGQQKFEEAKVSKEGVGGIFGDIFGQKKIVIDAGAGNDVINVKKTGPDAYEVSINGQKFTLTKEEMKNLEIKGGSGNDKITIDASVDVKISVDAGSGNDTITNKADGVTLDGGSGNDKINSTGDNVTIYGGKGADHIDYSGDNNNVFGGRGGFWDIISLKEDDVIHKF